MGSCRNPEKPVLKGVSLEEAKRLKLEELAAARWKAEEAGVEVQGLHIATDERSQSKITGAALQATIDPNYVCRWKTETGFIDLTAPLILGAATAVRQYVQSCFDREAALAELVAGASTIEEVAAVSWGMEIPNAER